MPNHDSGVVSVISVATSTVTGTISAGMPSAVAVDPAAGTVYVAGDCLHACVSVADVTTNTVIDTVPVTAREIAVDASTHTAYATNFDENTVSVISPGQAPAITSARSASIGMRSPAHFTVTTTGIPAPAITETGALPKGITFTDHGNGTATLSGIAATGTTGSYPITITASNGVGNPATQAFTLTVTTAASKPVITSAAAAAPLFGSLFNFTVTTHGYPVPSISKTGTMPPGVHFADNGNGTGAISGTPNGTAIGPYTVTLTVKNQGRNGDAVLHADRLEGAGHRQDTDDHRHDRHTAAPGHHRHRLPHPGPDQIRHAAQRVALHQHRKRPGNHLRHPGRQDHRQPCHHHHRHQRDQCHQPDLHPDRPQVILARPASDPPRHAQNRDVTLG